MSHLRVIVKGDEEQAASAIFDRGIKAAKFKGMMPEHLAKGSKLAIYFIPILYEDKVMRWHGELSGVSAPFSVGSLLYFSIED